MQFDLMNVWIKYIVDDILLMLRDICNDDK